MKTKTILNIVWGIICVFVSTTTAVFWYWATDLGKAFLIGMTAFVILFVIGLYKNEEY